LIALNVCRVFYILITKNHVAQRCTSIGTLLQVQCILGAVKRGRSVGNQSQRHMMYFVQRSSAKVSCYKHVACACTMWTPGYPCMTIWDTPPAVSITSIFLGAVNRGRSIQQWIGDMFLEGFKCSAT
jgi:hypothetical protein